MSEIQDQIQAAVHAAVATELAKLLEKARLQGVAEGSSAAAAKDETDYSMDKLLSDIKQARTRLAQLAENDNLMPRPTKDERRKAVQANQKEKARKNAAKIEARAKLIRAAFRGEILTQDRGETTAIQNATKEARGLLERKSLELELEARRQEVLLERLTELEARTDEIVREFGTEDAQIHILENL